MTDADERPVRRWLMRLRLAVVALLGAVVLWFTLSLWFVHRTGRADQARPVDAIVVLGAAQYDGRPSPQLAARLDHVVLLWERGLSPLVVTTGGKQPGDRFTEAQASAAYLEQQGVPAGSIVQVGGATTYESLAEVKAALDGLGLRSVLLVTDPYHSLRARLGAQELGLTAYTSPTRTSPVRGPTVLWREMKEAVGVGVGRVIGFDRLLRLTG